MYKNVHPNLALVLLFVRSEVECGKGLFGPSSSSYEKDLDSELDVAWVSYDHLPCVAVTITTVLDGKVVNHYCYLMSTNPFVTFSNGSLC